MKYVQFEDEEKIELFDKIAAKFYEANFGQLSKSDMELMMFNFYLEKMIKDNSDENGIIDFKKCTDYKISKDLGITQQKVRNLKIKKQLVYPVEYDWKKAFANLIDKARYDLRTGKVTIDIPDPNLYLEIKNCIEEQGAYVETQLNNRILQIRPEYYIDLMVDLEEEKSRKAIIQEIKTAFKKCGKDDSEFDEKHIGNTLLEAAVDITTLLANINSVFTPEGAVAKSVLGLFARIAAAHE